MSNHKCLTKQSRKGKRNKDFIDDYRKSIGICKRCGYNKYWEILTFHHRDPKTKIFILSGNKYVNRGLMAIENEMKKCDLVCPNCHAEIEMLKREVEENE